MAHFVDEIIYSTSMWNILNQYGFVCLDFSCGYVVNTSRGRKAFSDKMNKSYLDLILARCDRKCCPMEKLACPISAMNEAI